MRSANSSATIRIRTVAVLSAMIGCLVLIPPFILGTAPISGPAGYFIAPLILLVFYFIVFILATVGFTASVVYFLTFYGLTQRKYWSRSFASRLSLSGIAIFTITILVSIGFSTIISTKVQNASIIVSAIGISGNVATIYYLRKPNVREYYDKLRIVAESNNKNLNGNSFSLLSLKKITLFFAIFLIAEVFLIFVGALREAEEIAYLQQAITISEQIIFMGLIIFPIVWFSRVIENLKALGIIGLNLPILQAKSFLLLPIRLLYEPARLMKAVWKASQPDIQIAGVSWEKIAIPTGFGLWWAFFLVSRVHEFLGDSVVCPSMSDPSTCFSLGDLTIVGLIITPIANISTIILLRRIKSRIDKKRYVSGDIVFLNPVQKIKLQHPASWDRKVKDNVITIFPSLGWNSNAPLPKIEVSIKERPDLDISEYMQELVNYGREQFKGFKIVKMDQNAVLAGSRAFGLECQYLAKERTMRSIVFAIIVDGSLYNIKFEAESEAFSRFLVTAIRIINSFSLIPQQPNTKLNTTV